MYNEAIKLEFIESIKNAGTKKVAKSLFRKTGAICESSLDKDIAVMEASEILGILEQIGHLNYMTLRVDVYLLKRYAKWYNQHVCTTDLSKISSLSAMDVDLSKAFNAGLIKDEDELMGVLSFIAASDGYFEIPVILMSWLGLTLEEILSLKNEDVIFKDNSVFMQTHRKMICTDSDRIVSALREYKSVKSSIRSHRGDWIVYPDDLGLFIKNMVTKDSKFLGRPVTTSIVRKKIEQYNRNIPGNMKQITVDNVLLSGRLHRILESEITTGKVLPETIVNELRIRLVLVNDGIAMYNSYKKAFDIKIENKAE